MYRLVVFIVVVFSFASGLVAQESKGVSWYDKTTYEYYLKADWNHVIGTGKEALKKGIDFYYLRMRIGIAYFSKKNYRKAIPHFRKALAFDARNPAILEYLYYCYLYSGREGDRQALVQSFPTGLRERLKIEKVNGIRSLEVSLDGFTNSEKFSMIELDASVQSGADGFRTMTDHGSDVSFKIRQETGKIVSLEYGYHFLAKKRLLFYRDNGMDVYFQDNPYKQHQFFGSLLLHPAHGFTLGLSANYLNLRSQILQGNYGYSSTPVTLTGHGWTTRLSLRGDMPYISLYGGAGISGLNGYYQLQTDGGIVFYPLGNLNLYFGTDISYLLQGIHLNTLNPKGNMIYQPFLGFRIGKPLWAEVFGSTGNMYNYQGENGWILYNEMNPIKKSAGLNLLYVIHKSNITLTLTSSWSQGTSYYYPSGEPDQELSPVDYYMLNFKAGIKWTF